MLLLRPDQRKTQEKHVNLRPKATVRQFDTCARAGNQLLSAGTLAAHVGKVLPLSRAAEAHGLVETGQARGRRIILIPDVP